MPGSIVVAQDTVCTATVTDTELPAPTSEPSGTITFSSVDTGTFDSFTCALGGNGDGESSDCFVTYTPYAKGEWLPHHRRRLRRLARPRREL